MTCRVQNDHPPSPHPYFEVRVIYVSVCLMDYVFTLYVSYVVMSYQSKRSFLLSISWTDGRLFMADAGIAHGPYLSIDGEKSISTIYS